MRRWWIPAAFLVALEAVALWSHHDVALPVARMTYQWLWKVAPKPAGYVPPDRFRSRAPE